MNLLVIYMIRFFNKFEKENFEGVNCLFFLNKWIILWLEIDFE